MAESRDYIAAKHVTGLVEGAVGGRCVNEDAVRANVVPIDDLDREMSEVTVQKASSRPCSLQLPKLRRHSTEGRLNTVRESISEDMKMPLLSESTDKGQSSSWCLPLQSLSGMSETELQQKRVEMLFYLLSDLHLEDYEQRYREALQRNVSDSAEQAAQQGGVQAEWPTAEIDDVTTDVIREIYCMGPDGYTCRPKRELYMDTWEVVVKAFTLLIPKDESVKSTFDLVECYDAEKNSIPSSFYLDPDRRHLQDITALFTSLFILGLVGTVSGRRRCDENCVKRILARLCEALSWRLLRLYSYSYDKCKYAGDVFKMGKDLLSDGKYLHAVFAFYSAAELYKGIGGKARSLGITKCVNLIRLVVEQMRERPFMMANHVIPLMKELRLFLDPDRTREKVALKHIARCLSSIGYCYYLVGEHEESFRQFNTAIELMESEFERKANWYEAYGNCLSNAAYVCYKMGLLEEEAKVRLVRKAAGLCVKAVEAFYNTKDWNSDEAKEVVRKISWQNYMLIRRAAARVLRMENDFAVRRASF